MSLINHVYRNAVKAKIGDVYVVTGDKEIYLDVKRNGGKCVLTKQKHRSGTDRIFEGLKNLKKKKIKYVLNLQGDEPLINISDIRYLSSQIIKKKQSIGTLACKIENKSDIEILAIGIGHDVSRYYNKAIKITDVNELGDVMISQLSSLFETKNKYH